MIEPTDTWLERTGFSVVDYNDAMSAVNVDVGISNIGAASLSVMDCSVLEVT